MCRDTPAAWTQHHAPPPAPTHPRPPVVAQRTDRHHRHQDGPAPCTRNNNTLARRCRRLSSYTLARCHRATNNTSDTLACGYHNSDSIHTLSRWQPQRLHPHAHRHHSDAGPTNNTLSRHRHRATNNTLACRRRPNVRSLVAAATPFTRLARSAPPQ